MISTEMKKNHIRKKEQTKKWIITCCSCFIHSADLGSSGNTSTSFMAHKAPVSLLSWGKSTMQLAYVAVKETSLEKGKEFHLPITSNINTSESSATNKLPLLPLTFHWHRLWFSCNLGNGS